MREQEYNKPVMINGEAIIGNALRYSFMISVAAQPSEATLRAEVYDIVRQIPRGRVLTYGCIAALCGWPNHSRLVGRIMRTVKECQRHSDSDAENKNDADLPCHRVVNASGRLAPHYPAQASLLTSEGIHLTPSGKVPLKEYRWNPEC